jgi:PAS domain S-box-containing protein
MSAPPALAESWGAEELAATLDSVGTGIWAVDLEGRCVFVNQAACRIFGYSREECLGRNLQCKIHRGHCGGWCCPQQECPTQCVLANGSGAWVDDDVFRHRDGTSFPVQYSVQPVTVHGRISGAVISMTDIASRKRAEELLRKSDEWLGLAQRAAGVGIFDADLKTGETRVSEGQFLIYGLDPAGKWLSHEEWLKLIHPEDRDRVDRRLGLALSGAQFPGTEFRIVWPDGSIHWLLSQLKVLFDEAGTAMREVGVNVDVTSRVRAETVLSQFFSASPTPMAIWGFDGRIRQVNSAWEPLFGFAAAELEGLNLLDLVHPEDYAAAAAEFKELLISGKRTGFECRSRCKDGSYRWLLVNASVLKDAQVVLATAHDITNRKKAEEALRESEARFRSAFDNTLIGMAIVGLDGRYLQVSQSLCRITGFSDQEMLQTNFSAITHPDDVREGLEFTHAMMEGVKSGGITTKRYVRKNGDLVWVSVHVALVRDALGKPLHFITLVEDLSEQKRAEENARKSEERLRFTLNAAGIGLCHRESGETTASEQQFRLYGLEPAETWLTRERWLELIHPADRERVETEQRLAMEQGKPYDIQFRVVWPDGAVHWLLCRGKIFHDEGARKTEVTVDITERKRAEVALQEFFSLSRSPMSILGYDGSIKRVNAASIRILGFTAEEFADHPRLECFHPDDRPMMEDEFRKLITRGGDAEFECRGLRKDGSFVSLVVSATAVPDEKLIFTAAYDITERKRAEEALRESEAKFRDLFDDAPVAYHELDMGGVIRRVNRAECALLGYEAGEMLGRPVWEFVVGADREASREAIRRKLSGEQPLALVQRRYLRRDGGELWTEVHDILVRNAAGETTGIRTALLDITERKRAEEALWESRERLRSITDSAQDAILMMDHRGAISYWNLAAESIFGYRSEEAIGENLHKLLAPERYLEAHRAALPEFSRTGRGNVIGKTVEMAARRKDGREISVELSLSAVSLNGEWQAVGTVRDITERKRAEEALRANEYILSESQSIAHVGSWSWELPIGTGVCAWTPETYRVFGVSPDTFIPTAETFPSVIHPDDRAAMQAWIGACLAGEEPPDLEFRIASQDEGVRYVLGRGHLERDAENKPIRMTGIAQDITERHRMTEALKLNVEKLARSNEELERFAYVASHDLQEPLRMVASFTQLLAKRYSGRLDETADRYIHYAVDGAKRMQELIADLLAYSRVNSKELDLRQTGCEAVVLGAMRNLQVAIEESGACIDWDPLPELCVDQGQLTQVFQNLLANAIKFRRKEDCPRIHISAVDSGVEWLISVRDNGIGIDPRHAERVFQMFQRLHTRAEYPGTGIGLAVCKKVIERHGGKLWVESEPGAGSTFRFAIPKPERNAIGGKSANQTSRDSVD